MDDDTRKMMGQMLRLQKATHAVASQTAVKVDALHETVNGDGVDLDTGMKSRLVTNTTRLDSLEKSHGRLWKMGMAAAGAITSYLPFAGK